MSVDDKRIKEFAYQIWESEGKPDGHEDRHWEMARKLAEAEALAPSKPSNRKPAAAKSAKAAKPVAGTDAAAEKPATPPKPVGSKPPKPAAKSAPKPAVKSAPEPVAEKAPSKPAAKSAPK